MRRFLAWAVTLTLLGVCVGCADLTGQRLSEQDYCYGLGTQSSLTTLVAGQGTRFPLTVRNTGTATWPGESGVRIQVHWFDASGLRAVTYANDFAGLPHAVPPGAEVQVWGRLDPPKVPGDYELRFDLRHGALGAFEARGGRPIRLPVTVRAAPVGAAP